MVLLRGLSAMGPRNYGPWERLNGERLQTVFRERPPQYPNGNVNTPTASSLQVGQSGQNNVDRWHLIGFSFTGALPALAGQSDCKLSLRAEPLSTKQSLLGY